ncbi:2103_t:CDS:2, partial [Funneliformis geosporum]
YLEFLKAQAHNALGITKDRDYYKAEDLKRSLKQEHSVNLGKLAVENRVYKCKILTTGIRAVTGAVMNEFTSLKRKSDKPPLSNNDNDETSTKKARVENKNQETIDYHYDSNEQRISQFSTEDNLAKKCGLEIRLAMRLADFARKLNNQNENLCKKSIVETFPADFDLNKFRKELIEDLNASFRSELQNIKMEVEKIKSHVIM